ncbi:hypothetical protein Airi02_028900 [Actinoallomurus iriomotensis]|uniref:WXG100 family type VII secretion target n=1 Tax=Actinoallomurus iriomotensis TaxID=478107 RepID=A0A9W6S0B7_9ACTN|nr:hypothetical protein Airi02_028900 [Actinoallomurus iriomotensis]
MVDSYVSPMRSAAPAGSPSQYTDPQRIDALLKTSDPEAVAASGRSYQQFAGAYEKIAGALLNMRTDLHDAWKGEGAAAAQSQLREVWSAATTVHKTAQTFGVTIERHGSEYLAWYKYNKPPSKSLSEAQSWMTGANERVSQTWSSLPPDLSTSLPPGAESRRRTGVRLRTDRSGCHYWGAGWCGSRSHDTWPVRGGRCRAGGPGRDETCLTRRCDGAAGWCRGRAPRPRAYATQLAVRGREAVDR